MSLKSHFYTAETKILTLTCMYEMVNHCSTYLNLCFWYNALGIYWLQIIDTILYYVAKFGMDHYCDSVPSLCSMVDLASEGNTSD